MIQAFSLSRGSDLVFLIILGLVVGLVFLFFIALFVTSLLEKLPIAVFVPLERGAEKSTEFDRYLAAMSSDMAASGFLPIVYGRHGKGGTYRLFSAGALSSRRDILVIASGGTMARVRYRRTVLQSWVGDRLLMTTDEYGTADLSGIVDTVVVKNADFPTLLSTHTARLPALAGSVGTYTNSDPLACYSQNNLVRGENLESKGLARFTSDRTAYKHTFKGALILASKAVGQMRTQSHDTRMKDPRPGDPGFYRASTLEAMISQDAPSPKPPQD